MGKKRSFRDYHASTWYERIMEIAEGLPYSEAAQRVYENLFRDRKFINPEMFREDMEEQIAYARQRRDQFFAANEAAPSRNYFRIGNRYSEEIGLMEAAIRAVCGEDALKNE